VSRFWGDSVELRLCASGCEMRVGEERRQLAVPGGTLAWPTDLAARLPAGARVRAQVADRALRYLVLQWPGAVRGRKEREAWLAHQFKQVHGIDAADWVFAQDADPVGDPFIACAMPRALVDGLRVAVAAGKGRLLGLTGQFVAQFNSMAARMDAPDGALASVAQDRLTLGVWRDGRWRTVLSRATGDDATLARRELAQLRLTGDAADTGVLYQLGGSVDAPEGWTRVALEAA